MDTSYKLDEDNEVDLLGGDEKPTQPLIEGQEPTPAQEVEIPDTAQKEGAPASATTDEDLDGYDDIRKGKVAKRLRKLSQGYDAATREREEAVRVAQVLLEENRKLKEHVAKGQQTVVHQYKTAAEAELVAARERYKEAFEAGDTEKVLAASEAMQDAKLRIEEAKRYRAPLQETQPVVQTQPLPQQPVARPDPKAVEWAEKNEQWFGKNQRMTAYVYRLHDSLVNNGYDPTSDDYYEAIDNSLRQVFPKELDADIDSSQSVELSGQQTAPVKKPSLNVAPANRTTASRRVQLTGSQIQLARRLGITLEQYANEMVKLEKKNG